LGTGTDTNTERGLLNVEPQTSKWIYIVLGILCLTPLVSPPTALFLGFIVANLLGQPFGKKLSKTTKMLLQVSVVGLGFGMNLFSAMEAGSQGLLFTIAVIGGTLLLGYMLGRLLKIDDRITGLISSGTAICGGSAIAAVAPVIQAGEKQISVALGIVFILNSIALFVFPAIGHSLLLSEEFCCRGSGRVGPQSVRSCNDCKARPCFMDNSGDYWLCGFFRKKIR
jgi:uncharacterized membrane protein YadS